jgi:hypothetical protein
VVKLNSNGEYLWHTFYGCHASALALDSSGNVYIVGERGAFWSGPDGQEPLYHPADSGGALLMVMKLNASGRYQWHTFYNLFNWGNGIVADAAGGVYVVGHSDQSFDGPTGQLPLHAHTAGAGANILVLKLYSNGAYQWHTFYGDPGSGGRNIIMDNAGDILIAGGSDTIWNGPAGQPPLYSTTYDVGLVLLKLSASGAYLWHSFYSMQFDSVSMAVDQDGNIYLGGGSGDWQEGPDGEPPMMPYNDKFDFMAVALTSEGAYRWHTFYGSAEEDYCYQIALDADNNIYLIGNSYGGWTGPASELPLNPSTGLTNMTVLKLDPLGNYAWHTFYPLSNIADFPSYTLGGIDSGGNVYLGATTTMAWNGPAGRPPLHSYQGASDLAVLKMSGSGAASAPAVLVRDEASNPVSGAQVYRNGAQVGLTAANGQLAIPSLAVGDQLVARQMITEFASPRADHNQDAAQNWAYRVYLTSLTIPMLGLPLPHVVTNTAVTQTLTLRTTNSLIGFNIVASLEWDANSSYVEQFRQSLTNASQYLYDTTDGQMLFERATVYDNAQHWNSADIQVRASNQEWPRAYVNALRTPGQAILLGRYFNGSSAYTGAWNLQNGYHTQIHEFGHYGLNLFDSYFYYGENVKTSSYCTVQNPPLDTSDTNATLMDNQYNDTEFAMRDVEGLWADHCQLTMQWDEHHQSDWETIVARYADTAAPARWTLQTPATHGGVVAGPEALPIPAWSMAVTGNDAATGVCAAPPYYRALDWLGSPLRNTDVVVKKGNRIIIQGKTDADGWITLLGAASGDKMLAASFPWFGITTVECPAAGQALQSAAAAQVILTPAAFTLTTSIAPGSALTQAVVTLKPSVVLSTTPEVLFSQSGADTAISVPVNYEAGDGVYTGTIPLSETLPAAGSLLVSGMDLQGQTVEVISTFNIESVVRDQATTLWSGNGQAEVYLPAGALSADGLVAIGPDQTVGAPPAGLELISGPYRFQFAEQITLTQPANLSLYPSLGRGWLFPTAQIYRWEAPNWVALTTTIDALQNMASAPLTAFGTYALMAPEQTWLFLPLIRK